MMQMERIAFLRHPYAKITMWPCGAKAKNGMAA